MSIQWKNNLDQNIINYLSDKQAFPTYPEILAEMSTIRERTELVAKSMKFLEEMFM
ncbi:hypothetical protein ACVR0P_03810 [Streptococcus castoreus]|uniref:hypothetical protein n=1 Tax=Streptococcus castoreus TaxID=254786 RepID=UPI000429A10F|nr:hypothetical protein [Streptococcus castoreus]